jgi:hypothetical protein
VSEIRDCQELRNDNPEDAGLSELESIPPQREFHGLSMAGRKKEEGNIKRIYHFKVNDKSKERTRRYMEAVSTLFKVHLHATPLHRPLQPQKVVSCSSDSPGGEENLVCTRTLKKFRKLKRTVHSDDPALFVISEAENPISLELNHVILLQSSYVREPS